MRFLWNLLSVVLTVVVVAMVPSNSSFSLFFKVCKSKAPFRSLVTPSSVTHRISRGNKLSFSTTINGVDSANSPAVPAVAPRKLKRPSQYRREGVGLPKGSLYERYKLVEETKSGLPKDLKNFLVLGIESSCDDTGVAIVSSTGKILSNVVFSQYKVHQNFGGVVPSLAMEAHRANIDIAIEKALADAGLQSVADVDAIAVTKGPGLEICLRIGCRKAQALAKEFNKPFVTAHHLEGHCMIARLAGMEIGNETASLPSQSVVDDNIHGEFQPKIEFPFLTFLASGGHTSILLCKGMGDYEFLGGTLDDALGEAFDKAARLLGLQSNLSGGAAVEAMAKLYKEKYPASYPNETLIPTHNLRVPMRDKAGCDFSYAGLKSSFRKEVQRLRAQHGLDVDVTNAPTNEMIEVSETVSLPEESTAFLCSVFQDVAFIHVEDRLKRALQYVHSKNISVNGLVVVGGVAANLELRRRLLNLLRNTKGKFDHDMKLIFPPVKLCTDNGVMPAWAGVEMLKRGISNEVDGQEVIAKWPLGTPVTDLQPIIPTVVTGSTL